MGRPSLANERRDQILDAFERCICRLGLASSSLEKIAAEAGMARNMLRHYFGNREDLVRALIERFVGQYQRESDAALEALPSKDQLPALLDYLFGARFVEDRTLEVIFDELLAEAGRDRDLRAQLCRLYAGFFERASRLLKELHPAAPPENCERVAYGLIGLAHDNATMIWLGFDARYYELARANAERLLEDLEER